MNEPEDECVIDFWTNGTLKRLPVSSSNPRFINAAALLRNSCADKSLCKKNLVEDYSRLFAAKDSSLAPAYASSYPTAGYNGGRSLERLADFYNSYGWESKWRDKIHDDHLGIELLFLTRMVEKLMLIDDEPCYCEMKKEIRRFIEQHLLTWLPGWNKKINENANTLCYKGIATLIHACVEDLYGIFSYRDKLL